MCGGPVWDWISTLRGATRRMMSLQKQLENRKMRLTHRKKSNAQN
jgi:hypothetical protein